MKILFVETKLTGHHKTYLLSLFSACECGFVAIPAGETLDEVDDSSIYNVEYKKSNKFAYFQFLLQLKKIAKELNPDIIHFIYGDDLYRYFGFGLKHIHSKAKVVITCHQIRRSFLRDLSYRTMGRISAALVVHTSKIYNEFIQLGINNAYHIEYPQFSNSPVIDKEEALKQLGVNNNDSKVLLAIGGTRKDKGLDILLKALKNIDARFHLIIAGKEEDFNKDYIERATEDYRDNVTLILEFLTDEQFSLCLCAADIIVLPYRNSFDGASGPLGEGVWHYKEILGSDHKSLGELITSNHLGRTFKCEEIDDLRRVLSIAINSSWYPDGQYKSYRESLKPDFFQHKYSELYSFILISQSGGNKDDYR